jgi:hypothetical protein
MLNMVAMAEAAVPTAALPTRARFRMGTWLACAHTAVPRSHAMELAGPAMACARSVAADAFTRPSRRAKADIFGNGAQVAGAAMAVQQHFSKVNYAHTTRIAALKGGALGPHPARDPV